MADTAIDRLNKKYKKTGVAGSPKKPKERKSIGSKALDYFKGLRAKTPAVSQPPPGGAAYGSPPPKNKFAAANEERVPLMMLRPAQGGYPTEPKVPPNSSTYGKAGAFDPRVTQKPMSKAYDPKTQIYNKAQAEYDKM